MNLGGRGYWILVVVLIGISFVVGRFHRTLGSQAVEFVDTPAPQTKDVRYVDLDLDAGPWYPFENQYGPASFQPGSAGTHYVVRSMPEGDRIETLREIDGDVVSRNLPLPPDLQSITDTAVHGSRLWLADLLGEKLYFLDLETSSWGVLATPPHPQRVAASPEEGSLLVTHVASEWLMTRVDFEGGRSLASHQFGQLLVEQLETALALDGWITLAEEKIVFAGQYLGTLAAFSHDGSRLYLREMVRPPPNPSITRRDGVHSLRHDIYPASISLAADARQVFLLTYRRVGAEDRYVVDLYRSEDGDYQTSILLPKGDKWSSVAVDGNFVFLVGRSGVHRLARSSFEIKNSAGSFRKTRQK